MGLYLFLCIWVDLLSCYIRSLGLNSNSFTVCSQVSRQPWWSWEMRTAEMPPSWHWVRLGLLTWPDMAGTSLSLQSLQRLISWWWWCHQPAPVVAVIPISEHEPASPLHSTVETLDVTRTGSGLGFVFEEEGKNRRAITISHRRTNGNISSSLETEWFHSETKLLQPVHEEWEENWRK